MGNPNMEPPRTIAYETGVEYNLADQYLIRIAGYYKDITGEPGEMEYISSDGRVSYDTWIN
ncbi:MAG: TonB-dependent receptor, partial [Gammaproteobacteria bacterium]|nr:TonB-dependent receptor [Gammaproteobacteria bacterium]NIR93993.1 TonB-dependent receptor [Gammaproteobacteria bacterium]NIW49221.1 TonB-dependent receptor [Gammaproteobacteria bacterium]NIX59019.1 TonB-dependent receptor [candidate division Zixibacteria bacterium]